MRDFRGIEIKVGDTIAHAHCIGSNPCLDLAEVLEVNEKTIRVRKQHYYDDRDSSVLRTPTYIVVLDRPVD